MLDWLRHKQALSLAASPRREIFIILPLNVVTAEALPWQCCHAGGGQMVKYPNTSGCYLATPGLNHKTGTRRRWQTPLISQQTGGGGGSRLLGSLSWPV